MAECENCIHQYVCEKRTCAECVSGYCDECELYCQYGEKPDIENCKDFTNENNVVPVVKCSQCRKRYTTECALWYATMNDTKYFVERGEDFYCSYGEKK